MKTYQKTCKFCGEIFEANNPRQSYCSGPHYDTCVVCGNQYEVPKSMLGDATRAKTCSKKCGAILRKRTCIDKYGGVAPACSKVVQQKAQQTNLKHWGTKTPAENKEIQEKMKQTLLNRTGYEYAFQNPDTVKKAKATSLKKYGVDSYTKTSEFKDKCKETWLQNYGVDNPAKSDQIKQKMSTTYKERTGYETPFANPDVQQKINQTNLSRYNVKRVMQSNYGKEKAKQTSLFRYGTENPMQSEEIQSKVKSTNLKRYGSTCYFGSEEGKAKIKQTMQKKYKVTAMSQTRQWKQSTMTDPTKVDNLIKFREDCRNYIDTNYLEKPTLDQLATDLGINSTTVGQIILQNNCQDCINYVFSLMEHQVKSFIQSLDNNTTIISNTKQIITPYELDIYLPDYNLAIECNPTSTHNCSFSMFGTKESVMDKKYHQLKSQLCAEKGIQLFHIFGYEWTHRRTIIESMIRNLLHKNTYIIYGRNTDVKLVNNEEAYRFLDENHRQGRCFSSINIGLYNNNQLVSLMTFGKVRNTIGTSKCKSLTTEFELLRFCNKLNTTVVGGASKLFKYFYENYTFSSIRSYSDIAHTSGNLYKILGFKQIKQSDPGYVWVDVKTDKAYHRVNAQKQNIIKFLHDSCIDLNDTEQKIMEDHGFVWVYDSGTILWRYMQPEG